MCSPDDNSERCRILRINSKTHDGECLPGDNSERCKVVTVTDYGDKGKTFKSRSTSSYSTSDIADFDKGEADDLDDVGIKFMDNNIMDTILSSFGGLSSTFDEP